MELDSICTQFTNAEVNRMLADRVRLQFARRVLAEFYGEVAEIASRINVTSGPVSIREELVRLLGEGKYREGVQ